MPETSIKKRIPSTQYRKVAEAIVDEWRGRKDRRKDIEKIWDEVDRQLKMIPEKSHKSIINVAGQMKADENKMWMPEIELPLQSQTLETLTADFRRMVFPANRDWFQCRAALTEDYLEQWGNAPSPVTGEKGGMHAEMNQDNADKLVQAYLSDFHNHYNFRGHWDLIAAQSFSYGFGPGRMRMVDMRTLGYQVNKTLQQKIPVIVPRKTRLTYPDDSAHSVMHEGVTVGPNIIQERTQRLSDLKATAAEMPAEYIMDEINRLKVEKDNDSVTLLELEGDVVLAESQSTTIIRDVCVTVAIGTGKDKGNYSVVRVQKGEEYSTYIIDRYHVESPGCDATSPLIKGMPIAKAAAQALNRVMESGMLKNGPPIGYPKDSQAFAAAGGPRIHPYAQWETIEDLHVYAEVGGEPEALWQVFVGLVQLYSDVTGVTPARLGAQTKSHTTAYAKDVEVNQGAGRTVDYVRSTLESSMTRYLDLAYRMGLQSFTGKRTIFMRDWNEFATITKKHLPDIVHFTAIGSGAPAEEQARIQQKMAGAQQALQVDSYSVQLGNQPTIDPAKLVEQILTESGWTDISALTAEAEAAADRVEGLQPSVITAIPGAQ